MKTSDPITILKSVRNGLLELHRALVDSEKQIFERSTGQSVNPGTLLQLLASDPWFEWLRHFSKLAARLDNALSDTIQPLTSGNAQQLIKETSDIISPDVHDHGFGETYRAALQRDPAVLSAHGELRKRLKAT